MTTKDQEYEEDEKENSYQKGSEEEAFCEEDVDDEEGLRRLQSLNQTNYLYECLRCTEMCVVPSFSIPQSQLCSHCQEILHDPPEGMPEVCETCGMNWAPENTKLCFHCLNDEPAANKYHA